MAAKSISTHILDVSRGRPAAGVHVKLEHQHEDEFRSVAEGVTDADGRVRDWLSAGHRPEFEMQRGTWRIRFEVAPYFENHKEKYFYPYVEIVFLIDNLDQHYHVPLLLSAYGFSTYRGS